MNRLALHVRVKINALVDGMQSKDRGLKYHYLLLRLDLLMLLVALPYTILSHAMRTTITHLSILDHVTL